MNRNEVRDEIAAALEQVAGRSYVVRIEVALANTAKQLRETEAAELRAAGCAICAPNRCNKLHSLGEITAGRAAEPAKVCGHNGRPNGDWFVCTRPLGHIGEHCHLASKLAWSAQPAPPPSLVERARRRADLSDLHSDDQLLRELADALEAAQADSRRLDELRRLMERKPQLPQPPREDEAGERGKP